MNENKYFWTKKVFFRKNNFFKSNKRQIYPGSLIFDALQEKNDKA
jgi:hypothetical protein